VVLARGSARCARCHVCAHNADPGAASDGDPWIRSWTSPWCSGVCRERQDGTMRLVVVIPGRPKAWERARTSGKRRYHSPAMEAAADKIAARVLVAARKAGIRQFPPCAHLTVTALWARPGRIPEGHPLRGTNPFQRHPRPVVPDADNVAKLVMDAIGRVNLWGDDAQVTRLESVKQWASESEGSATIVMIEEDA